MSKIDEMITSFWENTLKPDKNMDEYINEKYKIHPYKQSLRIALVYGAIGALWILFSGKVLDMIVKDVELYKQIELYKGWFYILVTTGLVFWLVILRLKQFETAIKKIQYNYQELNSYTEELVAMDAELNEQVTELNKNKKLLMISEERYELAVEGADCGIWDYDVEKNICFLSPKWKADLGYEKNEILDSVEMWENLIHPEDREVAVEKFNLFITERFGTSYENTYRMRCKDGSYSWIQSRAKGIYNQDGKMTRIAGSQTDITQQKRTQEKLLWQVYFDSLTEIPNRISFEKNINDAIHNSKIDKFALVYLDIDDFKNINDAWGHVIGDYFLKYLANILKENIGEQDFIARLSGDEFAILFYHIDSKEDIENKIKKLMELSKKPWEYLERELFFSFSCGVSLYPEDGEDSLALLKNADIAMYAAKKNMKNSYCFYSNEINQKNLRRIEMIHELRCAIDNQEFELYYQPINQINNESVYGAEALIRWNHPKKGIVSPMEFIPLAEETGLICEIDQWVLKTAFSQKKKWEEQNYIPIKLSINISGRSLINCNLIEALEVLLEEIDIACEEIQIEITETAYMEDIDMSSVILDKIKEMGFIIALDDFGTGYSSLTYLEKLPIDIVKLDRKFIMNSIEVDGDSIIIQNLIKLTHDLKLVILAEGIETKEQLSLLQEFGCDLGQGYFFSKPVPVKLMQDNWLTKKGALL